MTFCCLKRIAVLSLSCVVLAITCAYGETFQGSASAAIQATATVVPPLGISSPEDNLLVQSPWKTIEVKSLSGDAPGAEALSIHRLMIRAPSLESVAVSIESESGTTCKQSLAESDGFRITTVASQPLQPKAVLVNLDGFHDSFALSDTCYIITLIYTEN